MDSLAFLACRGVGAYVYMQSCMHNSDNYVYRPNKVCRAPGREGVVKESETVCDRGRVQRSCVTSHIKKFNFYHTYENEKFNFVLRHIYSAEVSSVI